MSSLVLGYCHPGEVNGLFHDSVVRFVRADSRRHKPWLAATLAHVSGPRIASARNAIVQRFMETGHDWLLMCDVDMVFSPDSVYELLKVANPIDRPIVGALCFAGGRTEDVFPTIYAFDRDAKRFGPVEDYPVNSVVRVDGTGCAFLLMHRSALHVIGEKFKGHAPWFVEGTVLGDMELGEDIAFCLRAAAPPPHGCGLKIHVHTGVKVGHVKTQIVDEEAFQRHLAERGQIGAEGQKAKHQARISGLPTTEWTKKVRQLEDAHA